MISFFNIYLLHYGYVEIIFKKFHMQMKPLCFLLILFCMSKLYISFRLHCMLKLSFFHTTLYAKVISSLQHCILKSWLLFIPLFMLKSWLPFIPLFMLKSWLPFIPNCMLKLCLSVIPLWMLKLSFFHTTFYAEVMIPYNSETNTSNSFNGDLLKSKQSLCP